MGWTGTRAVFYKNGKVDVKAEMDHAWERPTGNTIIKSSMVGSTYYAAVRARTGEVFCAVSLTSTRPADGCNLFYKDMTDKVGPCVYDCPTSILKLLTPTEHEWANEWRRKCWNIKEQKKQEKKDPNSLKNLPVGSTISFVINYSTSSGLNPGDTVTLSKFVRTSWKLTKDGGFKRVDKGYWSDGYYRWPDKMIPKEFRVEKRASVSA